MTKINYNGITIYIYPPDPGIVIEDQQSKDTIYIDKKHIPGLINILQNIQNSQNQIDDGHTAQNSLK
jgi:hypothetical protein